jgi:hypothetical protein
MRRRAIEQGDLEAVWASTMAVDSCEANGVEPFRTFVEWKQAGMPSFLDYSPAEQRVIDAHRETSTLVGLRA